MIACDILVHWDKLDVTRSQIDQVHVRHHQYTTVRGFISHDYGVQEDAEFHLYGSTLETWIGGHV